MSNPSAQDEARRALADALEVTASTSQANLVADLGTLTRSNLPTILAALRGSPAEPPKEPPPGLLMSMALRYDHGLGMPGYYDRFGGVPHKRRLESALSTMRQLWEEVTGLGFYRPEAEADYAARLAKLRALPLPPDRKGGEE